MAILNLCTEVDELGNGRFRHTQHVKPIAYQKNGAWQRIGFTLGASGDPNLTIGADEYVSVRMRPRLAGNSPVVHFGRGQTHVRLTPLNTNNVDGIMVDTNGFEYPNAWNNADLRLIYGGHFLRKEIILRSGHPQTFSFRIDDSAGLNVDSLSTSDFYIASPFLEKADVVMPLAWQKSIQGGKLILTVTLPAGNWSEWKLDPNFSVQPDAASGKDTCLRAGSPANNYGTYVYLTRSVSSKGLIYFDLSSIPAGANCSSPIYYFYQVTTGIAAAWTTTIYSIASANGDWIEGTQAGSTALVDEPTWAGKQADGSGGVKTAWTGGAGIGVGGYESTVLGSINGDRSDPLGTEYAVSLIASRIKGWFGALNTNYGLLMAYSGTMSDFGSSDFATASRRPKFITYYTLAGGAPLNVPFSSPFRGAFG